MTKGNGEHDPNVTSLDEARRQRADQERAAQKAKQEKQQQGTSASGPRTLRGMLIGGVIIAMALGFIASLFVLAPSDGTDLPAASAKTEAAE